MSRQQRYTPTTTESEILPAAATELEDTSAEDIPTPTQLPDISASLMPELEELVRKNPNRLIGCGG